MEQITRMTKQKRIILDELSKLKTHPTADDLYKIVKRKLPSISLGTVYRNLEQMSESGTINKLSSSDSKMHFDADLKEHVHFRCNDCGGIYDLDISLPGDLNMAGKILDEHVIESYSLEYRGVCNKCKK